jgi:hypothetical protein
MLAYYHGRYPWNYADANELKSFSSAEQPVTSRSSQKLLQHSEIQSSSRSAAPFTPRTSREKDLEVIFLPDFQKIKPHLFSYTPTPAGADAGALV